MIPTTPALELHPMLEPREPLNESVSDAEGV
jgi:hypothetical protein